ncbi:hypothetical protein FH972_026575 [Carpinus fangiana]|uniref:Uncharacterized protein n=1 Tax=Carpinus fangiana TaxID=176857 RepID=A0A5N6L4E2_9ROSI|nr:hypothetical protein FH972_026575 [Carpinus fangiana]
MSDRHASSASPTAPSIDGVSEIDTLIPNSTFQIAPSIADANSDVPSSSESSVTRIAQSPITSTSPPNEQSANEPESQAQSDFTGCN